MSNKSEVFASVPGVDEATAFYWNGPMSRREAQKVFDDYTAATIKIQEQVLKLDFAIGYLLEKFEVTPEQVKEFMDRKMLEYAEKLKAEQAAHPTPEPKSSLVLES